MSINFINYSNFTFIISQWYLSIYILYINCIVLFYNFSMYLCLLTVISIIITKFIHCMYTFFKQVCIVSFQLLDNSWISPH